MNSSCKRLLRLSLLSAVLLWGTAAQAAPDGAQVGRPPPQELELAADGTALSLDQFKGKVVVVTFWASWCGPCMRELPILDNVQRKVSKDRLVVVAVNIQDRQAFRAIKRALADKLALTIAHDSDETVFTAWGRGGIPYLLMIDAQGKLHTKYRGYGESSLDHIVADLNALLALQAAAAPSASASASGT